MLRYLKHKVQALVFQYFQYVTSKLLFDFKMNYDAYAYK